MTSARQQLQLSTLGREGKIKKHCLTRKRFLESRFGREKGRLMKRQMRPICRVGEAKPEKRLKENTLPGSVVRAEPRGLGG